MIKFKLSLIIVFVFAIQNISFSQTNIDFETGNLNGWTGYIGANMNTNVSFTPCSTAVNPPLNGTNLNMIVKSYFSMMTTAAPVDPYGLFSLTSPLGGNDVIRLGNENTNVNEGGDCSTPKNCAGIGPAYCSTICGTPVGSSYIESPAEAVVQTFAVTSANDLLTYAWAAVLNDGGHSVGEEPYFEVKIYNQSGVEQTCFTNRVIQKTGITSPGWTKSATKNCWYPTSPASDVYYKSWTTVNVLLSNYIGQNITVRFAVAGCVDGGHFGYAYFDAKTGPATITPSNASPCGSQTITLSAPTSVSGPYSWSGPGVVSGASTGTVTVNAGGTYTLSVGTGTCVATMTTTVTYSGGPSVTASAGSPTICNGGGPVILTAGGATTYTWSANAGSATTSTVSVNPGSTTIYTVTGTSGGCTGTQTVTVNVTPTPTLTISGTTTLCNGQSTVLTAGTSAGTYTWSANAGGGSVGTVTVTPGLGTTTYTLSGDNSGCPGTKTISVTVNPNPIVTISGSNTVCSGNPVVLSGSTTAGTFTWSANAGGGSAGSATVSPTGTTTYTLSGSNGACTASTTIQVTVTPTPTLTVNSPSICTGGSAVLTAATASTYTWSTGATTNTISVNPGSTTVYTVTGDNGNGCTVVKTATVNVTTTPTVNISGTSSLCSGNPVVLTGATATNYTWSTGATTNTISVTPPAGNTTYTLTGANGVCTATASITLTVTPTPTLAVNSPTICSGNSTVLTAATANTYTWNTGATTNTISVNPGSTTVYTVTGDDGNGCTVVKTATVTVNTTPTVSISGASPVCSGTTLVLTGGTATNYTWMPGGQNTSTISITPPAGTNTYTLTGANGTCTASAVAFVDVSATPTITIAGGAPICSGQNIVLNGGGASTYTWSANAGSVNTNTASVTPTTTTVYTLTGSVGTCTSSSTTTVNVTATPTLSVSSAGSYTICDGSSTSISANGATTFTWTTGTGLSCTVCASPNANPNTTTVYTVSGTASGCVSAPATVTVNVNPLPNVTAVPNSSNICSSTSTTITANGGTTYTWSPSGSLSSSTGSPVTATPTATITYTLTGTDNNGCVNTNTVSINVAPTPTMNINAVPGAICVGQSVVLNGGTATTYTWSANAGSANTGTTTVTPNTTDTYTLIGTIGTCTSSAVTTVTVNPVPVIGTSSVTSAPCGQSTGCISSVSVSGGTPTYTYSWNGGAGSTSSQYCNQPAGTYTLVVTDANGCTATQNISIPSVNGPGAPTVAVSTSTICIGGTVTLTVTPAQAGYTYTWTDNTGTHTGTTYTVTNITPAGNYSISITATDQNGCLSAATNTVIGVTALPNITTAATQTLICSGTSTTLTASGATSYTWMPGGLTTGTITVNPGTSTIYTVSGTSGGCPSTQTVAINVNPTPTLTINAGSNAVCSGQSTTLSAGGATSYTWMPGNATTPTITVTPGTTTVYTVTGDSSGCKSTQQVSINVTATPTITANASQNTICSSQTATLTASGATSYSWNPGGTGSTINVTPNTNTTYTVIGMNGNCSDTTTVNLSVTPTPTVNITASSASVCVGQTATLTASGATTYTWMPTNTVNDTLIDAPNNTTTYTVTGNNSGCTNTQQVTVTVNPLPTLTAVGNQTVCSGGQVTAINYNSSGGATVNWTNTNINVGITAVGSGNITGYSAPNVVTQQTGIITATPMDNTTGCTGAAQSYTVIINPSPTASGGQVDSAKCGNANGGVTGITASGGTPGYTYQWYNNGVLMPGQTNSTLSNVSTGNYSVLITDANGCTAPASATSFTVNGSNAVVASITPPVSQGQAPLNITFVNNTTGASVYGWSFGNGQISNQQNPAPVTYNTPGTYTVLLTASNGGCLDTATAVVIIDAPVSIVVPNIYSPNGDGINDDFFIQCSGIRDLHCDIFNRWGQLVYQLLAPNDIWNGIMNNGNHASEGTYYYILDATGYDGKQYKSHGSLTLVK